MSAPIPALDPYALVNRYYTKPSFLQAKSTTPHGFIDVRKIEEVAHDFQLPVPLTRTRVYAATFVRQGQLVRTDGLITHNLGPDTLYFDAPNQIMSIREVTPDCTGYFMLFDADYFLHELRDAHTLLNLPFFRLDYDPLVRLPASEATVLYSYFEQMEAYFCTPEQPDQHALISTLLYLVCLRAKQFCRPAPLDTASAAATLAHKFQRLLPAHILGRRTVADYADLLAVTPDHLSKCVKRITGKTAGELITAVLVMEACVLLRQTDLPISEVAAQLRINDLSYFGRLIRKHTGCSPTVYRRLA
jgi:AraC-like DNA-binding protein